MPESVEAVGKTTANICFFLGAPLSVLGKEEVFPSKSLWWFAMKIRQGGISTVVFHSREDSFNEVNQASIGGFNQISASKNRLKERLGSTAQYIVLDRAEGTSVAFFALIVAILPEPDASRLIVDDGLGESEPPGACIKEEGQQQQQQGGTRDSVATPRRSARNKAAAAAVADSTVPPAQAEKNK
eukprot:1144380-Pelagomonas_calceolata.AAC.3